jgi:putative (di)nucleoside polyphosphate hydrolase
MLVVNDRGQVWVGERRPKWAKGSPPIWQLPQGGLLPGEPPDAAALRELYEETGMRSVEILGGIADWVTYLLPEDLVGVALKGKYRGQKIKWFVLHFTGPDCEIDISARHGRKAEFDRWRWCDYEGFLERAPEHRRTLYETVGRALLPIASATPPRR